MSNHSYCEICNSCYHSNIQHICYLTCLYCDEIYKSNTIHTYCEYCIKCHKSEYIYNRYDHKCYKKWFNDFKFFIFL